MNLFFLVKEGWLCKHDLNSVLIMHQKDKIDVVPALLKLDFSCRLDYASQTMTIDLVVPYLGG